MKVLSIINGVPPRFNVDGSVCVTDIKDMSQWHVFGVVHDLEQDGDLVHVFDYDAPNQQGLKTDLGDWRPQQIASLPISEIVFERFKYITHDFAEMDQLGGLPFYYDVRGRYCADQGPRHINHDGLPYIPQAHEITDVTLDARTKENPFGLRRAPMNCFVLLAFALELSGAPLGLLHPKYGLRLRDTFQLTATLRRLKDLTLKEIPGYLHVPTLVQVFDAISPRSLGKRGEHLLRQADFLGSGHPLEGPQTMMPWYLLDAYARVLGRAPDARLFPRQGGKIHSSALIPSQT